MKKVQRLKIFIVEDDAMYSRALENYLCSEIPDIQITTFSTGEACLHSMHLDPDLVVLDYLLNSEFPYAWNGLDIYEHIKRIAPYTSVVMLSCQRNIDTELQTLEKGLAGYVVKSPEAFGKIKQFALQAMESMNEEENEKKEGKELFSTTMLILALIFFVSFFMMIRT